jgi:hypothetical protein
MPPFLLRFPSPNLKLVLSIQYAYGWLAGRTMVRLIIWYMSSSLSILKRTNSLFLHQYVESSNDNEVSMHGMEGYRDNSVFESGQVATLILY